MKTNSEKNKELAEKKLKAKNPGPEWKPVIDAVLEKYEGTDKGKFITLRYKRNKGVVPICMELYISQRTHFAWRDEIINEVILQAAYRQLIKP